MQLRSIFFLVIFSAFLVMPAIIAVANARTDMSSYFTMNEEETNNNNILEIFSKYKIDFKETKVEFAFAEIEKRSNQIYLSSNFESTCIEIQSPPPEHIS